MISTIVSKRAFMAQVIPSQPLQWRLRWNWEWPLWLTVLLVVLSFSWVMFCYLRENANAGKGMRLALGLLRILVLAMVLMMFAQPTIEWFQLSQPRLVVLVDTSLSMSTVDRYPDATNEVSRMEAWQSLLTDGELPVLDQWRKKYRLDVLTFDSEVRVLDDGDRSLLEQLQDVDANTDVATGTRLGDAVDYALRDLPGAVPLAVVLMTDGIGTRGQSLEQAARKARLMRVPLHVVAIGSDQPQPDIGVENLVVEEIVFPGDRLQVEATIRAKGLEGKSVEVVLSRDASDVLASTTISLPSDDETRVVSLAVRPTEAGALPLTVSIVPLDEERNRANNRISQVVEVRDEKIRVLLVENQPTFEYRALKSLLERDPAVELKVLLQEADADYASVDDRAIRAFPISEHDLFSFDVLVLGDVDPSLLPRTAWPRIERFVSEYGGGFVGIAGPRFMPAAYRGIRSLETLLPIGMESFNPLRTQLEGGHSFAVYPTAAGWRNPSLLLGETLSQSEVVWQSLPKHTWLLPLDEVKPGSQVLAECPEFTNRQGQRMPIILQQYVGAGEVLFHATDETWRWRYRTDDRYYARYWGQVVRRLGRGRLAVGRQGVQVTSDRSQYQPSETVQLQARFRNPSLAPAAEDGVVVRLQAITGPAKEVALHRRAGRRGLFSAKISGLQPGEYEAQIVRPDLAGENEIVRFAIRQPPQELARVAVNQVDLREAAEATGGRFYTITDVSRLSEELPPPRAQSVDQRPSQQLWNSHAAVALLVTVLATEWLLRRRVGML